MAYNKPKLIERSYLSYVLEKDPNFYAKNRDVKFYEFSNGREFRGNPNTTATAYPDE